MPNLVQYRQAVAAALAERRAIIQQAQAAYRRALASARKEYSAQHTLSARVKLDHIEHTARIERDRTRELARMLCEHTRDELLKGFKQAIVNEREQT
jgi:uncharacterized membrane protein